MRRTLQAPFLILGICMAVLWITAIAPAKMHSVKIAGGLCQTTGGKKIVPIPGFPGERTDRRILPDLKQLIRKYKLFVIDGYSNDPVHAANGEHPMGLAADFAPDFANGGSWNLVDKLAKKAEPKQNQPIAPYRWVGYDGDPGHGRGDHLHISWSHSELTGKRRFPKTVLTKKCPAPGNGATGSGSGTGGGSGSGSGSGGSGNSGGVTPGSGKHGRKHGGSGGGTAGGSGGVTPRLKRSRAGHVKLAAPNPETAAESAR